jgi:hypothetical protein
MVKGRADQDDRVHRTHVLVQEVVGEHEHVGVVGPVHGVGAEQTTEEQDFGRQEQPHAEFGRLVLLLHGLEVVGQVRIVIVVAGHQ